MRKTKTTISWLALLCIQPAVSAELNSGSALESLTEMTERSMLRDPFTPSSLMYQAMGMQSGGSAGGFMPNIDSSKVPKMRLKGFVNDQDENMVALLEVANMGTFMVREGDEINVDPSQPRSAIRISNITRLSITVEAGTIGTIRILR